MHIDTYTCFSIQTRMHLATETLTHTLNVITTHSYIRTHKTNAQQLVENTNELGPIVNALATACSLIHTQVSNLTKDKTRASHDFMSSCVFDVSARLCLFLSAVLIFKGRG